MSIVPILAQTFPPPEDVARQYAEIVANGIYSNQGPKERQLAREIAAAVGQNSGVCLTSSATAALQLACHAAFESDRRFVIVPSFTFAAGPLAARWCGFEIVFFDVDGDTWQPSCESAFEFVAAHRDDVAGILLTQTFGVGTDDIERWELLSAEHDGPLVIDSAAGFGSVYADGRPLGGRGRCEVFSLHATKMLAIGEGGAVTSTDLGLIARLDRLKNFGFDEQRTSVDLGLNAKLDELSAAIGLLQMRRLRERVELRRAVLRRYRELLTPLGLRLQRGAERSAPAFLPATVPEPWLRDRLIARLADEGIECRAYYSPPVHRHAVFADAHIANCLTVTDDLASRMISLPLSDHLSADTVDEIAQITEDVLRAG